jgi:hypothetical protein
MAPAAQEDKSASGAGDVANAPAVMREKKSLLSNDTSCLILTRSVRDFFHTAPDVLGGPYQCRGCFFTRQGSPEAPASSATVRPLTG